MITNELMNLTISELTTLRDKITSKEIIENDLELIYNIDNILKLKSQENIPQIPAKLQELTLQAFKENYIKELNKEGNRRIRTFYGKEYTPEAWTNKGQNLQDIKTEHAFKYFTNPSSLTTQENKLLSEAVTLIARKNSFVKKIKELELIIMACNDILEIRNIKIYENETWSNVEYYDL